MDRNRRLTLRKISDQTYLLTDQYKDAAKLTARIELPA